MTTIDILDIAGTFVFAIAGAFRATRHHLDLLGIMVLAVATGVGGGMIRDMLLGAAPVAAIQSELYLASLRPPRVAFRGVKSCRGIPDSLRGEPLWEGVGRIFTLPSRTPQPLLI